MSDIIYGGSGSAEEWTRKAFPKPILNSNSLAVTPLEVLDFKGQIFAHGTAFVYILGGEKYLVTAWHNVSGRHFFTRKLNSSALIPHKIQIYSPGFSQEGNLLTVKSNPLILEIGDEGQKFLDSPPNVFSADVDVAVIKLPIFNDKRGSFTTVGLNEFDWGISEKKGTPLRTSAGSDVFVLGYPLSSYTGQKTPIWKRGIIANETSFAIEPQCAFLVDVNSAKGMSGGPIIRRITTMVADNKDDGVIQEFFTEAVVGVYTGRAQTKEDTKSNGGSSDHSKLPNQWMATQANAGFVLGYGWPIDIVHEIIDTKQSLSGA